MNILVVDDEPLARARLRRLIEALPGHACVGEAADGAQAVSACERLCPDLVLLDIRMPGPDGLATARALAELAQPPAVVFTTAYADFALDAFEAGAAHYLLKPISAERLGQALARVGEAPRRALLLTRAGQTQRVALADVLYVRADAKYLTVYTRQGEWLLEDSLSRLMDRFPSQLLRIHRSLVVNIGQLNGLQRDPSGRIWARVDGVAQALPVSRRLSAAVQEAFQRP